MNQSDLILEFIDGTLDTQREQGLFEQMAGHPELRAELRQYVMIGDAVRADWEAYMPPADVEKRLLGGLGVLPPAGAAGAAATAAGGTASGGGGLAVTAGLLSRLKNAIVPLMVGFVVGGLFVGGSVYLSMNPAAGGNSVASLAQEQESASPAGIADPVTGQSRTDNGGAANETGLPASTERDAEMSGRYADSRFTASSKDTDGSGLNNKAGKSANRNDLLTIPQTQAAPEQRSGTNTNRGIADGDVSELDAAGLSEQQTMMNRAAQVLYAVEPATMPVLDKDEVSATVQDEEGREDAASRSGKVPEPAPLDFKEAGENSQPFTLELRKSLTSGPIVDNNALRVNNGFLSDEDFVVSAYYSLGSGVYTGLELGRERYAQKLFHNRDGILFIEQRPVINWLGGTLGAHLDAFSVPFFVQAGVGVSEYGGPMGRGRVGVDLMDFFGGSSGAFSIPLSVEASSLVYRYNRQYLATGNWGLNAGAQFRFGL